MALDHETVWSHKMKFQDYSDRIISQPSNQKQLRKIWNIIKDICNSGDIKVLTAKEFERQEK